MRSWRAGGAVSITIGILAACASSEHAPFFSKLTQGNTGPPSGPVSGCVVPAGALAKTMFHGGRGRLGWNADETSLTAETITGGGFVPLWSTSTFDDLVARDTTYPGRMYASPLFV